MEEIVIRKFHPTRFRWFKLYLAGIVLLSAGLIGYFNLLSAYIIFHIPLIFLPVIFAGLILIAIAEIKRIRYTYIITSQKIIERYGILSRAEDAMEWSKVSITTLKQNFIDRLLNIGEIQLWSIGGAEEPEIIIEGVPKVKDIKSIIDGLIKEREIISAKLEVKKPEKEVVAKFGIEEAFSIASHHLASVRRLHILSVLYAKFLKDLAIWRILAETEGGFYLIEISNEKKIVGEEKLSTADAKERLRKMLEI